MADELVERELMLNRFRRLIGELVRGSVNRPVFQQWEIDLLVDIEHCPIDPKRREAMLRRYERAVTRQLEQGPGPPMKFSDFLQRQRTRRPSIE